METKGAYVTAGSQPASVHLNLCLHLLAISNFLFKDVVSSANICQDLVGNLGVQPFVFLLPDIGRQCGGMFFVSQFE